MIRCALAMLCLMAGCAPDAAPNDQGVSNESTTSDPVGDDIPESRTPGETEADDLAGRQVELDQPAEPPPLPGWWFDGPVEINDTLMICLQAYGATPQAAGEAVNARLMEIIADRYGETPVEVDVTQDITLLVTGQARLAARFQITPVEDPDG